MSYRDGAKQGPTSQSVIELLAIVEEYEGSEYALVEEPSSHSNVLCSCVKLIADLTERIERLESKQRHSEAKVGR